MESTENLEKYIENHYIHRSNWLRAAVLGANDGIISITSIAIGVASAGGDRDAIVLSTVAGLVAGALSMAAGEYVSVSSQTDVEKADIEREKKQHENFPEYELVHLSEIYQSRGLKKETADLVAKELMEHNALDAHMRDELGINDMSQAKPLQAAFSSGVAFTFGGILPLLIALIFSLKSLEISLYGFAILFLIFLGILSAKTGGSNIYSAIIRVSFWGTIAMGLTALVGYLFGIHLA
ncbi:MAG: VIT family protein [Lutibacter sp.]|nr:VIT family protein [Lutibacter sp.]MBP9601764.1 VIT family protein [Lutibacter sp.]